MSLFSATFLPFLASMCVFLLGMGIVNPLGTAQALSPFGEKAGAASALVGFWQMMSAAIAVWLAATVSHQAMFALGDRADGGVAGGGRALHDADEGELGREIAPVTAGHHLVGGNIGIERVEVLRAADAAQREPSGGHQIFAS